jgi:pimeloyl-ACP methyl ester carboxylesterase
MNALVRRSFVALTIVGAAELAGCFTIGDARQPIGMQLVPAPSPGAPAAAIVVLPGFGVDASDMREHGIDAALQKSWPQADVLLTDATFAYYPSGKLVSRLETDVMGPVEARYPKVFLAGASLGGMGALLYEHAHPGEAAGLLLFAPFLGNSDILDEIRKAGGVKQWQPGPAAAEVNKDNYQREMWRTIKSWSEDPARARRVWLVCGEDDHLLESVRLAAQALPASHFIEVKGGHSWKAWAASAEQVLAQVRGGQS